MAAFGTKRTYRVVCYLSASGAKADICQRLARMIDAAGADRSGAKLPSALQDQKHRPAATSRRSLQVCIASLPLQSSLMSKTYLKSDHFNGGGSLSAAVVANRSYQGIALAINYRPLHAAVSSTGLSGLCNELGR